MRQRATVQGFTLLELMIVVAIIAILAAFAMPAYMSYVLKSKIRTAQSDLLALAMNGENYRQRTLGYYSTDKTNTSTSTTDVQNVFTGWYPAQGKDFRYAYDYTAATTGPVVPEFFTVTANGISAKLTNCVVTLTSTNVRTNSSGCPAVGATW